MKVLFLSDQFTAALDMLKELLPDDEVLRANAATAPPADVIIPTATRVDSELMDRVRPRLIQQFGVGLDGVDLEAANARGIQVGNVDAADSGNADAVAEITLFHLLALSRRTTQAATSIRSSRVGEPIGRSLVGRKIVLLGVGSIGKAIARRLRPFDTQLVGVGRRDRVDSLAELGVDSYRPSSLLIEALDNADALVVGCALNEATKGLIGAGELAALRPGALLINVARGPVVQYEALLTSLQEGQIGGAGLDVFWTEPIDPKDPILAENVSLTPHIGGATEDSYWSIAEHVAERVNALRTA